MWFSQEIKTSLFSVCVLSLKKEKRNFKERIRILLLQGNKVRQEFTRIEFLALQFSVLGFKNLEFSTVYGIQNLFLKNLTFFLFETKKVDTSAKQLSMGGLLLNIQGVLAKLPLFPLLPSCWKNDSNCLQIFFSVIFLHHLLLLSHDSWQFCKSVFFFLFSSLWNDALEMNTLRQNPIFTPKSVGFWDYIVENITIFAPRSG